MGEVRIPETADIGLAGVVAFSSKISAIVGSTLTYCGYTIEDLAENSTFEETAYLLWKGHLPNEREFSAWREDIARNMQVPAELAKFLAQLPKTTTPMDALRTSVSLLQHWDEDASDKSDASFERQSLRLLARMGGIVTAWHRIRNGLPLINPDPKKTIAANFFFMLNGKDADPRFVEVLDSALVLHADHTMNASTFSARVTTSSQSDVYSAITAAVGTLKGPLHGGANEAVMRMLDRIGSMEKIETWLKEALAKKEKIMGFGHRVYKNGDPRAKILRELSKEICAKVGKPHLYEMSVHIHDVMEGEKGLYPNVDFYSASLYHALGIPTDLFTPVFAVSRISGWLAQVAEQRKANKIIRPESVYIGEDGKTWKPCASR
jgi:citrate synthase